ncbi:MAG: hypothetical protein ACRDTD_28960 [Pseudonocardiaceae bacterium]
MTAHARAVKSFLTRVKHAAHGGAKVIEFVVLLVRRSGRPRALHAA